MPSPVKPALQVHVRPPGPFEQTASAAQPPLAAKPALHAQVKLPTVLVHVALALQGLGVAAHSLRSRQTLPPPLAPFASSIPAGQTHLGTPPAVLQVAMGSQASWAQVGAGA